MKPKDLAIFMHNTYEKIAKKEKWETQKRTRVEWSKLPRENKKTMLKVAKEVLKFVSKDKSKIRKGYD